MKKIFTFIGVVLLVASAAQVQAQVGIANALYPGLSDSTLVYRAPKATTPPAIDGDPSDVVWQLAPWKSALRVVNYNSGWGTLAREEPVGPFAGVADCEFKYKFIWDNDRYYMLLYWKDDNVVYADVHNGYGKMPVKPAFLTGKTVAANGAGDGTSYNSWEMDQISLIFSNYYQPFVDGTIYTRQNTSLWYSFFPAKVTHSTEPEAVLWAQSNNLPSGVTEIQKPRYACKYNSVEKAYYVEFADTTWTTLFKTVNTQYLTASGTVVPQKNFETTPVAVGDRFLFSGEVNDADGTTNRRDYSLFVGAKLTNPNNNATESVVIELVNTVPQGLNDAKVSTKLDVFPNPVVGDFVNLSRVADVQIFSLSGHLMLESKNSVVINISNLKQGVYMVKDSQGNVTKLVRN